MSGSDASRYRFDAGVTRWREGLGRVRDAVRQELVARQLSSLLAQDPGTSARALDLGCGRGTQAILLARPGYEVVGVDLSEEILGVAPAAAMAEPGVIRRRLHFKREDALDLPRSYRNRFDVVCCHGVLMYVPSLAAEADAVVRTARPGGLISLLTRNPAGVAMRA
ncbi:MAG: class I SAM-dependent methyltransferase [Candidatus Dormibacteraeota bacterium]|nr:class I SAM-dependent methyltransferase [Candidatus Dormibacteraeota bacterium]